MKTNILLVICLSLTILLLSSCTENSAQENSSLPDNQNIASSSVTPSPTKNSNDDIEKIVKKAIDLEKFQQYYHISTNPERKPVYILQNKFFPEKLNITKFDESVEFADCDELKKLKKSYIEFTELEIKGETANVTFRYYVEGIEIKIEFTKKGNDWNFKYSTLVEKSFSREECS